MSGYTFALSCRYCGGDCKPRTASTSTGMEARAIADCTDCGAEMMVIVILRPAEREQRSHRCGSNSGYVRHCERKEAPCPECREARREYMRELRARRRQETAA